MALVGFGLMRSMVLGGGGMKNNATMVENPLKFVSNEKRVMNGIALIPFGLGKIIFPKNLSYDYSYNQIKLVENWADWRVVVGMVLIISSMIALWTRLLRHFVTRNDGWEDFAGEEKNSGDGEGSS